MAQINERIVTARVLNGLEECLGSRNVEFRALARAAGVPAETAADADAFVSFKAMIDLFERAAAATGDDAFCLHFAEANPLGPVGLFHYLIVNAPTVRDALVNRARYTSLVTNAYSLTFAQHDGFASYIWHLPNDVGPRAQYTDYVVMLLVTCIRLMLDQPAWTPLSADLDHKPPASADAFLRAVGPGVRFDQSRTAIDLDAATLDHPIRLADPKLLGALKRLVEGTLAPPEPKDTFLKKATEQIVIAMPSGTFSLEAVASALAVSPRTLQARLAQAGTTFRRICDATRLREADRLLLNTTTPLSEVAFLLGFSELSAFSRVARKWFGMPASEYRRRHTPSKGVRG